MNSDSKRNAATVPIEEPDKNAIVVGSPVQNEKRTWDASMVGTIPGRIAILLMSLAVFVAIWQALSMAVHNTIILASPLQVFSALISLFQGYVPVGATGIGSVYAGIWTTVVLIAIGYFISLIGIPIGIVMGRWRAAESIIDPWINALYAIPMVALTPLIYPLTGGSFSAAILVVVLISVFTIIINTYSAVKYTTNTLAEVAKTFKASEFQFLTKVVLPASAPEIVAGMRLGLGRAVLGAVVAEVLVMFASLGQEMLTLQNLINTPASMAIVVVIALIGILALQSPRLIEHYAFKWKETERLQRGLKR